MTSRFLYLFVLSVECHRRLICLARVNCCVRAVLSFTVLVFVHWGIQRVEDIDAEDADGVQPLHNTSQAMLRFTGHFPPIFLGDGKEDFLHWCKRFEVTVEAGMDFDNDKLAKLLLTCLGGTAFSYWDSLPSDRKKRLQTGEREVERTFWPNNLPLHFSELCECSYTFAWGGSPSFSC